MIFHNTKASLPDSRKYTVRKRYLIAYDISDDKRRNSVFKILMGNGDHVQFSVFLCQLNDIELLRLKHELKQNINNKHDQIIILNLGPSDSDIHTKLECIGKPYSPPVRVMVI